MLDSKREALFLAKLMGIATLVCLLVVLPIALTFDGHICKNKLEFMELQGGYSGKHGCYVQLDSGKKVLLSNYKAN